MVAKIVSGKSVRGILIYNENKVEKGQAKLFMASGFAGDVSKMNLAQKNQRFEMRTMLNPSVKTNALHLTLNFHEQDKLDSDRLQGIVSDYMDQIGFGEQPFLVYLHEDTFHPHVHIVTTNIKADGKRIDIHGIGYKLSENARKAIEQKYNLTVAGGRKQNLTMALKPAIYGESQTKKTIAGLVSAITAQYHYQSLAELNAVLKTYNLIADRGNEDSFMFKKRGVVYSMLDDKGDRVGIPLKASAIYSRPTLDNLEKRFKRTKDNVHKEELKNKIETVIAGDKHLSKSGFETGLKGCGVDVVFRANEHGRIFGLTYVDHNTRTVFNGSELGKNYSAASILRLFSQPQTKPLFKANDVQQSEVVGQYLKPAEPSRFLEMVLNAADHELNRSTGPKKKRKKKKQLSI